MYRQTVRLTSHVTEVYDLPGCSEALLRSVTQIPRNRFWDRGIRNAIESQLAETEGIKC